MKHKILFFTLIVLTQAVNLHAQMTKSIVVSHKVSSADQLSFNEETKEQDLTVKFFFDEDSNTLKVVLTSPKPLFVFWADTRYKDVFSCRRWLQTENLPYEVSSKTADRFRATKSFRKSLKRPRRKHLFKRWLESDELKPVEKTLHMVNDSIVQTFSIPDRNISSITLRLHEVMTLNEVGKKGFGRQYEITQGKDFNMKYRVTILRNPCLGLDDDVSLAESSLDAIKTTFSIFKKKYATGRVSDEESRNAFREAKAALMGQFPAIKAVSPCPDIQQARDQYNLFADSIRKFDVKLEPIVTVNTEVEVKELNIQTILSNTRQLDRMVARWLGSKDDIERDDLVSQCLNTIKETSALIGNNEGQTPEERNAIALFRKARQYFNKVVKEK